MSGPRIVSLLPSGTEICAALGLEANLVGRSHECDFPSSVAALPVLTRSILETGASAAEIDAAVSRAALEGAPLYAVDGEALGALEPDLILTQGVCAVCAVSGPTVEKSLELLPVDLACSAPVLSLEGKDFEGILADVQRVGDAAGVSAEAAARIEAMRARWHKIDPGPKRRVMMLEWPDPPWIAGHWVPEQVARAGGVDVFGTAGGLSTRTTWDAVAEADPDIIVVSACGFDLAANAHEARQLFVRDETRTLRAVREGAVYATDANSYFSRPAPRVIDGASVLAALLRGETLPGGIARVNAAGD